MSELSTNRQKYEHTRTTSSVSGIYSPLSRREKGGGGGGVEERERENSELYYKRIKILGSCLFL